MKTAVIFFMIVASLFAIATLIYVAVDIILEKRKKAAEPVQTGAGEGKKRGG